MVEKHPSSKKLLKAEKEGKESEPGRGALGKRKAMTSRFTTAANVHDSR